MNIKTVVTMIFNTSKEVFEGEEFQEVLNKIKSGELSREFKKSGVNSKVTYWTDYKKVIKEEGFQDGQHY